MQTRKGMGVEVGNDHIYTRLFADKQLIIVAEDEKKCDVYGQKLREELDEQGFELNMSKIQYMTVGTDIQKEYRNIREYEKPLL